MPVNGLRAGVIHGRDQAVSAKIDPLARAPTLLRMLSKTLAPGPPQGLGFPQKWRRAPDSGPGRIADSA